jgi:mannobiose 2-epimerase
MSERLNVMAAAVRTELETHILPFWRGLLDERGGFYGQMTRDLRIHPDAPKGIILHARSLWSFSSACGDCAEARQAFQFLQQAWDTEHGGFYWSLTADLKPFETDKYAYANAFCIYGLCAYARASGDKAALSLATEAFRCIETHFAQENGYIEAFRSDWSPLENDHLSEHDLHAAKTMNTTLHLIEAYTELWALTREPAVGQALRALLLLTADTVYNPERERLEVFFDEQMRPIGDLHSYGHDIEASWLLDRACACLGDDALTARFRQINLRLAAHVYNAAFHDGALFNECFAGEDDKTRVWLVQAEGVSGFLNAARSAEEQGDREAAARYTAASADLWDYIERYQIDRRAGGEWFAETDRSGGP